MRVVFILNESTAFKSFFSGISGTVYTATRCMHQQDNTENQSGGAKVDVVLMDCKDHQQCIKSDGSPQ